MRAVSCVDLKAIPKPANSGTVTEYYMEMSVMLKYNVEVEY